MASSLSDPNSLRCLIWTLDSEPTLPPRFSLPNHVISGPLSPRSFFPAGPRFSLPNHVTSGSRHVTSGSPEPAIPFPCWSAVSYPGCYDNLSTNQKPEHGVCMQIIVGIWAIWAPFTTNMELWVSLESLEIVNKKTNYGVLMYCGLI